MKHQSEKRFTTTDLLTGIIIKSEKNLYAFWRRKKKKSWVQVDPLYALSVKANLNRYGRSQFHSPRWARDSFSFYPQIRSMFLSFFTIFFLFFPLFLPSRPPGRALATSLQIGQNLSWYCTSGPYFLQTLCVFCQKVKATLDRVSNVSDKKCSNHNFTSVETMIVKLLQTM